MVELPGASGVAGQVTAPTLGSETATPVMVTLPVLVTVKVYGTVWPAAVMLVVVDALSIVSAGSCVPRIVTWFDGTGAIGVPTGGVATTEAVLTTEPASTSACTTVWAPVHVVDAFGARVVTGQDTPVVFGSDTAMAPIVTLPVLVTRNEYGIVCPTGGMVTVVDDLTIVSAGSEVKVTVASLGRPMPTTSEKFDGPLVKEPVVLDVTGTVTMHETAPASRLPPTETVDPPISAVTVPAGHVVAAGPATTRPAGRVSTNDHPFFAANSTVFVTVMVSVDVCPTPTAVDENDLSSWGVTSKIWMLSSARSFPAPLPLLFTI